MLTIDWKGYIAELNAEPDNPGKEYLRWWIQEEKKRYFSTSMTDEQFLRLRDWRQQCNRWKPAEELYGPKGSNAYLGDRRIRAAFKRDEWWNNLLERHDCR